MNKQHTNNKQPERPTPQAAVAEAERTIAALEQKQATLNQQREADDAERSRIAFAAHAHRAWLQRGADRTAVVTVRRRAADPAPRRHHTYHFCPSKHTGRRWLRPVQQCEIQKFPGD
jgi:hypothetical protein